MTPAQLARLKIYRETARRIRDAGTSMLVAVDRAFPEGVPLSGEGLDPPTTGDAKAEITANGAYFATVYLNVPSDWTAAALDNPPANG